jgi:hypothetical protein
MHHRIDLVFHQEPRHQIVVTHIADNQIACSDGLAKTFGEIVDNDDLLARLTQLPHYMAADVTGTAGDQNCIFRHGFLCTR